MLQSQEGSCESCGAMRWAVGSGFISAGKVEKKPGRLGLGCFWSVIGSGGSAATLGSGDRHQRLVTRLSELDDTVGESVDGEVLAEANILTRVVDRAALADDDVAIDSRLATKDFYAEAFTCGVAVVLY